MCRNNSPSAIFDDALMW